MSNYNKSRSYGGWWGKKRYLTRKDWYHKNPDYSWSWYRKKRLRKHANGIVRRYKGDIPNGAGYKKLFDLEWTLF